MAYSDEHVKQYQADLKKASMARAFNNATSRFRAIRETRMQQERDRQMFTLDKKQKELQIKQMEMDPRFDPASIEFERKKLKLGNQQADLALKKQEQINNYAMADESKKMEIILKNAKQANFLTEQFPDLYGNYMIVPDPETGQVSLKERSSAAMKTASDIKKNEAITEKNRVETARKMAMDQYGAVDEAKFQNYLKNMGSAAIEGTAGEMVTMTAPDGSQWQIPSQNVDAAKSRGFK